jgi:hypothetical protein
MSGNVVGRAPRTVAACIVAILVIVVAAYLALEVILHLVDQKPLLVSPGELAQRASQLPQTGSVTAVVAIASVVAVVGIILVVLAVAPGRRARHAIRVSAQTIVVDNEVIASALAERVRQELNLPRGAVVVGVGHRAADVTVKSEAGQHIDAGDVKALVTDELAGYDADRSLKIRTRIVTASSTGGR